jgi:hypothetical protein
VSPRGAFLHEIQQMVSRVHMGRNHIEPRGEETRGSRRDRRGSTSASIRDQKPRIQLRRGWIVLAGRPGLGVLFSSSTLASVVNVVHSVQGDYVPRTSLQEVNLSVWRSLGTAGRGRIWQDGRVGAACSLSRCQRVSAGADAGDL